MSRPVTIHSDGTARGTVILDENGKRIENVSYVSISIGANSVVEATIEIAKPSLVTQADVTEVQFTCPCCGITETHQCDKEIGSEYTMGQRVP